MPCCSKDIKNQGMRNRRARKRQLTGGETCPEAKKLNKMWRIRPKQRWKKPSEETRHGSPSSTLAWRIPRTEEPGGYSPRGRKSDTTLWLNHHHQPNHKDFTEKWINSFSNHEMSTNCQPMRIHDELDRNSLIPQWFQNPREASWVENKKAGKVYGWWGEGRL